MEISIVAGYPLCENAIDNSFSWSSNSQSESFQSYVPNFNHVAIWNLVFPIKKGVNDSYFWKGFIGFRESNLIINESPHSSLWMQNMIRIWSPDRIRCGTCLNLLAVHNAEAKEDG